MRFRTPSLVVLFIAFFVQSVWSQELEPQEPVRAGSDTMRVVGERLPEDVLKTPMAATEVPASLLETSRTIGLDEALEFVPGAQAQSRSGAQDVRIMIRGFGARGAGERSNAGTTRGIRILLDGFPLTEPDGRTSLDLADLGSLDRIRVVRSNASVLFGSASGGVIDLVSHAPHAGPFYDARVTLGSFGLVRSHARAGIASGTTRLRFSASDTRFEGWREHSASETSTVQLSVLADPSPRTSIGFFLAASRNHNQQPGPLTLAELDADPRQADSTFLARHNRRENVIGRLGLRGRHDFSGGQSLRASIFVEPKTLHRSERNVFRDFQRYHTGGNLLYNLLFGWGHSGGGQWSFGLDEAFQDGTALFYDLGPGGSRGTTLLSNKREAINTLGLFTELRLEPSPRWEITTGGRVDLVTYIFEDFQEPDLDEHRTLHAMSPRLALAYRPSPHRNFYAALSGGIEAPAFNEVNPPDTIDTSGLNPFLEPAKSLTLEVGAKGRVDLGTSGQAHFRYDTAVYAIRIQNDVIPFDGGAYYFTAGKSRRFGVELGGEIDTGVGLVGRLACNLSHNEYIRYTSDLGTYDGNETAGIPPFRLDARLRYEISKTFIEGTVHVLDRYFADDANITRVPGYQTIDATIGTSQLLGPARVDLFFGVRNLFDKRHVASVFINGVGGRFFEPGLERNLAFGLTLRAE